MLKLSTVLSTVAAVALLGMTGANASLVVSASVGGIPTGVSYQNFNALALGNAGGTLGSLAVSFTGTGKAVQGAAANLYAAPYLSNNNGTLFGDFTNGPDATTYLTTGTGSATITFGAAEHYVGLLWGSVDAYNTLELWDGATKVGTVTGTDVTASANGNQGANGTFYVNILSSLSFDKIVAKSTQYAFEFDNLSYSPSKNVLDTPEPISLSLFGFGLAGLAGLRRKRRS